MVDNGEIRTFNPNKEISKEITLEILTRHRDSMKQARTGELPNVEIEQIHDNDRKLNQVRALNLIISSQREMITISRPIVYFRSLQIWKKKHKEDKDKEKNPFEKEENDYNRMIELLDFLRFCSKAIQEAEKTKSVKDDFLATRMTEQGRERKELTENFHDMVEELEGSYEKIYLLMLTNKIVSAGIEEDEELTYQQLEEEAIKRVVEA